MRTLNERHYPVGMWGGLRRARSLHAVVAGLSAGLLCAAAFAALSIALPGARAAVPPDQVVRAAPPPWNPPALPREWRWEIQVITFDHMFRRLR